MKLNISYVRYIELITSCKKNDLITLYDNINSIYKEINSEILTNCIINKTTHYIFLTILGFIDYIYTNKLCTNYDITLPKQPKDIKKKALVGGIVNKNLYQLYQQKYNLI